MSYLLSLLAKERVNVAHLEMIYLEHGRTNHFPDEALGAMRQLDSEIAWRAAWLLCRCARENGLSEEILARIASTLGEVPHWIARLNLCQLFAYTGCPSTLRETVYSYFVACFNDRRVIIRAWAITVLATFREDPDYTKEIEAMLYTAHQDPSKSMKARLRHLPNARSAQKDIVLRFSAPAGSPPKPQDPGSTA